MVPMIYMLLFVSVAAPVSGLAAFGMDDYAVYSAVLAITPITDTHASQRLLIAQETLDSRELPSPLKICPQLSPDLQQLIKDLLTSNQDERGLPELLEKGKFRIERPWVMINPGQADLWRRRRFQPQVPVDPPDREIADPFPEPNLIQLSRVLFNADRTSALVYVSRSCGSLCGSSSWRVLGKKNGAWNILPSPVCGMIN
ncbi:MAG: hypothetical protein QOJ99_3536 [Bryobacterales bacterium]|nr:hypothetical protein [Bryobacterales bacterium]